MRRLARRILAAAEVSRVSAAFGAVANVWLMVFLARRDDGLQELPVATLSLPVALGAGVLLAVGFHAFGAALNDFLDAKHDRAFAPERALPSGNLPPRRAMQLAFIALGAGLLGAAAFGPPGIVAALLLGGLILLYDAFGKHVPAFGIVLFGLATALSMLVPAISQGFLLPVWLAMSQTMGVAALAYVLGEKRPRLTRRATLAGAAGWVFWSAMLLGSGVLRHDGRLVPAWLDPALLWIPAVTVILGAGACMLAIRGRRGPRASDALLRLGSLWKSVVVAAWLVAAGLHAEAIAIASGAALLAATLTVARTFGPQFAEPVGWRS